MVAAANLEGTRKKASKAVSHSAERINRRSRGMLEDVLQFRSAADLLPIGLRLAQNPVVRHYVRAALSSSMRKRFPGQS